MTREEIQNLSDSYFRSFRAYSDLEIQEASDEYANTGEYYPPKPAQIINLIKSVDETKHNQELIYRYTCSMCKQRVVSISDGVCLDCLGIPKPTYSQIKPLQTHTPSNYRMEGRIMCQECGSVSMCIKEPSESGQWKCRKCYTGMNNQELAGAFRRLSEMVG